MTKFPLYIEKIISDSLIVDFDYLTDFKDISYHICFYDMEWDKCVNTPSMK